MPAGLAPLLLPPRLPLAQALGDAPAGVGWGWAWALAAVAIVAALVFLVARERPPRAGRR